MAVRYNDILSISKIKEMYKNIRVNTCHREKLVKFELAFSCNIVKVYNELMERKYNHGEYNIFLIREPKYRIIMSENMHDKIVNHLVSHYVLLPSLEKKLIDMNVATRKDKGTKMGVYYFKKYVNKLKENYDDIYILKCDISKYFYNVDHEILLKKLFDDIKDKELFLLIKNIIDSTDSMVNHKIDVAIRNEKYKLSQKKVSDIDLRFAELDRIPRYSKGKGLPIGNETSQILAIYYLSSLDHYIKEKLRIKCYIRYMDDFLLFHHDKDYLRFCLKRIEVELSKLGLDLNRKTQIYDLKKGVNFLGFKFFLRDKKLIMLINNQTKKRVKRKLKKMKRRDAPNYSLVKASYNGYFMQAATKEFLHRLKL